MATGSIQPHGTMIVCDARAARILRSANVEHLRAGAWVGQPLRDLIGAKAAHAARNALARFAGPARPALLAEWALPDCEGLFDLSVHASGEETIIEIETAEAGEPRAALDRIRAMVERIGQLAAQDDIDRLLQGAARLLGVLALHERVTVLRFEADGTLRAIADQKTRERGGAGETRSAPIGAQTRADWLRQRVRVIVDLDAAPTPLAGEATPLDLGMAHLRAANAEEAALLRAGGAVSAMALALVVEGEIWGLILCSDAAPKQPGMDLRASAELFGEFLSLRLEAALLRRRAKGDDQDARRA